MISFQIFLKVSDKFPKVYDIRDIDDNNKVDDNDNDKYAPFNARRINYVKVKYDGWRYCADSDVPYA